jgi:Spy/CpxP family protein refolding chaperone
MSWGGHHRGGFDPARMREFAEARADRLLYELDATPEQRQQVKEILGQAFDDMSGLREQKLMDRQAFLDILSQPQIDRARLQELSAGKVKQMEQMSTRMTQAIADAAEVLTPEQRARLGDVIGQRGFGPGRDRW